MTHNMDLWHLDHSKLYTQVQWVECHLQSDTMEEVLLRGLLKLATNRHVRLPTWQMDAYGGLASGKTWKDKNPSSTTAGATSRVYRQRILVLFPQNPPTHAPVVQITIAKMHVVEIVIHRLPEFKRLSQLPWEQLSITWRKCSRVS